MDSSALAGWQGQKTAIRRLRLVTGDRDPLASRATVARWLDEADLDVPGLAPGAVLCVRRLADPLAGRWHAPRGPVATSPRGWQQAVTASLAAAAMAAARPAQRAVPANAEAVLFADAAELLACLAEDWLAGSLTSAWWWQSLLGAALKQGAGAALLGAWLGAPPAIPAALHLLARRRSALPFVQALPDQAARSATAALATVFGLHGLPPAVGGYEAILPGDAPAQPPGPAPWVQWAPEATAPGLGRPQAALLGIGLGLYRAPSAVRKASFAGEVAAWLAAPAHSSRVSSAGEQAASAYGPLSSAASAASSHEPGRHVVAASRAEPDSDQSGEWRAANPPLSPESHPTRPTVEENPAPAGELRRSRSGVDPLPAAKQVGELRPGEDAGPSVDHGLDQPGKSGRSNWFSADPATGTTSPDTAAPLDSLTFDSGPEPAGSEAPAAAYVEPVETLVTDFGGAFYLVNLGIYLGLYGDFSAPLQPGIELCIYDFVALLAEGLCADRAALHADPLWPLLARLAGRSAGEPPAAGFAPPDGSTLGEWLETLLPAARLRLIQALGLPDDDPAALSDLLLAQRARVVVSATRLDVFFALDDHPVAIRISGLDRDPGWVPAAGRFVAFHFETAK